MGIWTDVFTAPVKPSLPPAEVFGRLVLDLARERVVRTPWALLAGTLCVNACINWGSVSGRARFDRPAVGTLLRSEQLPEDLRCDDPPPWGDSHEEARLLARGDAILDVLPALRAAPYGREDIAVVFNHLDFENRAISDYLRYEDHRTTLVCFALAQPQHRPLAADDTGEPGGPTHPVQTCVVHTFKHADHDGLVPPIASVLTRHLGSDLITGETWG
ncbi:hypothetical protein ADK76_32655 [Streptomyces griseoflavus]|uniref:hypothetical protein n=1 Tax=Streptomyces rimosus TaxID=1927 RepID=UPI0004C9ECD7|nr:hypothetical protein [Streptomyces rimosus]KOG52238.1 hypothetical protein ADK76_32655 [Streptomyces griseoflavus]